MILGMTLIGKGMLIMGISNILAATWWIKRDWLKLIAMLTGFLLTGLGGAILGYIEGIRSISFINL